MLNAVISVAQGTDVAIEPAGVGVKFSPGEILDPINDLVEKFSTLMLFASISFGIQKILITLGGHWVVSAALSGAAILWSVWHVSGRYIPEWCTKLLVRWCFVLPYHSSRLARMPCSSNSWPMTMSTARPFWNQGPPRSGK
jgi:hypothetical protein